MISENIVELFLNQNNFAFIANDLLALNVRLRALNPLPQNTLLT